MALFILVFLGVLFAGCDENVFTPKAPFEQEIAVFAVMDATTDLQVVRLETTYDAESTTPDTPINKKRVDTASVLVVSRGLRYVFHDTLISGAGVQRRIWIHRGMILKPGATYTLRVRVPGFSEVTGSFVMPNRPFLDVGSTIYGMGRRAVEIGTGGTSITAPAKGYYFRLFISGEKLVDGRVVAERREIPVSVAKQSGKDVLVYPDVSRRKSVIFPTDLIARVRAKMESDGFSNMKAIVKGYTLEVHFYNYFMVVRGFNDELTFRQDVPDMGNITNGVGVFGAMNADSLVMPLSQLLNN